MIGLHQSLLAGFARADLEAASRGGLHVQHGKQEEVFWGFDSYLAIQATHEKDEQKKELNRKKRDENAAHAYEQILGELGFANVGATRRQRKELLAALEARVPGSTKEAPTVGPKLRVATGPTWVAKLAKPPSWSGRGNLRLTQTVPCKL